MVNILNELQSLLWLILPLLVVQLLLLCIGIRDWRKKRDVLGANRVIWLLIMIFINIIGPLVYLYYSNNSLYVSTHEEDKWEA